MIKMPEKEPNNSEFFLQLIPFLFAVGLSCLGGIVSYLNRIKDNKIAFDLFRFCVEILTSGFVGIVSFVLCDAAGFGWSETAFVVAISGHMGAKAITLFENAAIKPLLRRYSDGYSQTKTSKTEKTDKPS